MVTTHYVGTVEIVINQRKARGDLPLIHIKPRFVEGYIIPSECSFQTSSGENRHSRQLMAATRQQFCRDTVNTFGHDDQNFQWSRAYSYYSSPSAQKEVRRWSLGAPRDIFQAKEFQGNPPAQTTPLRLFVL
jgi:hypothetical protein